jgi:nicotinic acid mononucleotide adenylyltransferase
MNEQKEEVIVAVSGGFDPVHVGHIRYFEEARKRSDKESYQVKNWRKCVRYFA